MSRSIVRPRLVTLALVVSLMVAGIAAAQLALPGTVSACYCAAQPIFTGNEQAVFVGTVGQPDAQGRHVFVVERWFKGGSGAVVQVASDTIVFADGSTSINTCGLHLEVGDHLLLTASVEAGTLTPGLCSPHAAVDTPEGQQLLAAAIQTFGDGLRPGAVTEPELEPDAPLDLGLIAIASVGAIVLLALALIVLAIARRGPPSDTPA